MAHHRAEKKDCERVSWGERYDFDGNLKWEPWRSIRSAKARAKREGLGIFYISFSEKFDRQDVVCYVWDDDKNRWITL